jgi:hypothetical protein
MLRHILLAFFDDQRVRFGERPIYYVVDYPVFEAVDNEIVPRRIVPLIALAVFVDLLCKKIKISFTAPVADDIPMRPLRHGLRKFPGKRSYIIPDTGEIFGHKNRLDHTMIL